MMGALEASHAVKLLDVNHTIPFHYGTFPEHTQTPDEFIELTRGKTDTKIHILKAGEIMTCGEL